MRLVCFIGLIGCGDAGFVRRRGRRLEPRNPVESDDHLGFHLLQSHVDLDGPDVHLHADGGWNWKLQFFGDMVREPDQCRNGQQRWRFYSGGWGGGDDHRDIDAGFDQVRIDSRDGDRSGDHHLHFSSLRSGIHSYHPDIHLHANGSWDWKLQFFGDMVREPDQCRNGQQRWRFYSGGWGHGDDHRDIDAGFDQVRIGSRDGDRSRDHHLRFGLLQSHFGAGRPDLTMHGDGYGNGELQLNRLLERKCGDNQFFGVVYCARHGQYGYHHRHIDAGHDEIRNDDRHGHRTRDHHLRLGFLQSHFGAGRPDLTMHGDGYGNGELQLNRLLERKCGDNQFFGVVYCARHGQYGYHHRHIDAGHDEIRNDDRHGHRTRDHHLRLGFLQSHFGAGRPDLTMHGDGYGNG